MSPLVSGSETFPGREKFRKCQIIWPSLGWDGELDMTILACIIPGRMLPYRSNPVNNSGYGEKSERHSISAIKLSLFDGELSIEYENWS